MIHGSGAGVSGWANWRGIMPLLAERFRVVVPDLVGFGYTEVPDDIEFTIFDTWSSRWSVSWTSSGSSEPTSSATPSAAGSRSTSRIDTPSASTASSSWAPAGWSSR